MSDHAAPTLTPDRPRKGRYVSVTEFDQHHIRHQALVAERDALAARLGEQAALAREWQRSWESVSQSYHDAKQDSWMLQERLGEQAALVEAAVAYGKACEAETVAEQAWVNAAAGQTEAPRQAWLAAINALRVASLDVLEKALAYAARQAEPGAPADGSGEGQGG